MKQKFQAGLMSIFSRSLQINPLYLLFALFVLVPNLVLGIYGYSALTKQQMDAEAQMEASYQVVIKAIIQEVNKRVEKQQLQAQQYFSSIPFDELQASLTKFAEENSFFKYLFFAGNNSFVYPQNLDAKLKQEFDEVQKNVLLSRIDNYTGSFPAQFVVQGIGGNRFNSYYVFQPKLKGQSEPTGFIFAMLDDLQIKKQLVEKKFTSLNLKEGINLCLDTNCLNQNPQGEELFSLDWEGHLFPYWKVAVKVPNVEEFRRKERSSATIFLMLFSVLLPLVGGAVIWLLWRLLKDIKLAYMKTDFISRVTHELRTPLTSIKMFSEMLVMDSIPEQQKRDCVTIIQRETERLGKLVDRVLNFSKLESRNKVFSFAYEDIEVIAVEAIRFFEQQIRDKNFKIRLIVEPHLPKIMLDKEGIREILLNLIENSYKYSGANKHITVKIFKTETDLKIQVIDKGFGIPREDQHRVFQKFYRVDDQINRGIDGTGLGLSICREIARAHSGEIELESERGVGSKFTVTIPLSFKPAHWAKYQTRSSPPED